MFEYKNGEQRIEVLQFLSDGQWHRLGEIPFQHRVYEEIQKRAIATNQTYTQKKFYTDYNSHKTRLLHHLYQLGYVERQWANKAWYLYRITPKRMAYLQQLQHKFNG